jgi:hypothetical protein
MSTEHITLNLIDTGDSDALVITRPEFGRPVTFTVCERRVTVRSKNFWGSRTTEQRWVVSLKGSTGEGFSTHRTYDAALKAALIRARKYVRAYSRPVGIAS